MNPKANFKVWRDGGYSDEPDEPNVYGFDEQAAAEDYAARHFVSWEYPSEMRIFVRDCHGVLSMLDIEVEQVPQFHASHVKLGPPRPPFRITR